MTYRILSVGHKTNKHCPECGLQSVWDTYTGDSLKDETAYHHHYCSSCAWIGNIETRYTFTAERDQVKSSFDGILADLGKGQP